MSITMQGTWTVQVKSKDAAFQQRFQIAGTGTSADRDHAGEVSPITITTGSPLWSINIQHQMPGGGWQDSRQRITFPVTAGGLVTFDILSDDSGGGDEDFNDLVLTCSMRVSAGEFILFGNVETYAGNCLFNPCYRWYFVIDRPAAFEKALKLPSLRKVIEKLYPERTKLRIPPIPPDPPPFFKPIVLPSGTAGLATGLEFRSRKRSAHAITYDAAPLPAGLTLLERSEQLEIAKIADRSRFFHCDTEPAPSLLLRFQEYDRTNEEKLGNPYTGTGPRENLGLAVTDERGNYIFRFSRSLDDFDVEADDTAAGEALGVQLRPDVIVQVLGTGSVVEYESAPYYNVPPVLRVDLCLPRDRVHPARDCSGDRVLQRIGDIIVLHSALGGSPNTLDPQGRITCRNANAPQVDCAGWRGDLRLYACFGNPDVKTYSVSYRWDDIDGPDVWHRANQSHTLNYIPLLWMGGVSVGPSDQIVHAEGGSADKIPTYTNHEGDSNWIESDLKLILTSSLYRPNDHPSGPVDFKIEGYDSAGNLVADSSDTIRLYIHNPRSTGDIISITMGSEPLGDCALFELTSPSAPLSVRFRAQDPDGFVHSWGMTVKRGNNHDVHVSTVGGVAMAKHFTAASDPCLFRGTLDEATADLDGYVLSTLQPTGGGTWLPANVTFCAFAFTLTVKDRVTDGRDGGITYPVSLTWSDLIGLSDMPATTPSTP